MALTSIPVDLFLNIAEYLTHSDLAALAATCDSCHKVVTPILYHNPVTSPKGYQRFTRCLADSKSVLVRRLVVFDCSKGDDPLSLPFRCSRLEKLCIVFRSRDGGFQSNSLGDTVARRHLEQLTIDFRFNHDNHGNHDIRPLVDLRPLLNRLFRYYDVQDLRVLNCYPGQNHLADFYTALQQCSNTSSLTSLSFNHLPCGSNFMFDFAKKSFHRLRTLNLIFPSMFSRSSACSPICRKFDVATLSNFVKTQQKQTRSVNIEFMDAKTREFILHSREDDFGLSCCDELRSWILENGLKAYCQPSNDPAVVCFCQGRVFIDAEMGTISQNLASSVQSLFMQSFSSRIPGYIDVQYDQLQKRFEENILLFHNLKSFRQNGAPHEIISGPHFQRSRINVLECSRLRGLAQLPLLRDLELNVNMFRGGTNPIDIFFLIVRMLDDE